ncbi:MAG: dihydroxyacetone kinase subunit DhaK [Pseudomonadota bacterium]
MKKLINAVDDVLTESLQGFAEAHGDLVKIAQDPTYVIRSDAPVKGKVALISGGGSGHEPLHAGFVGYGMLDAACPGQVFTSPTPDQMVAAAEAVDGGAGVLLIVKNYSGDVMNFEMAGEMLSGDVETVLTNDDVAVEDSTFTTGRRGVAGTVLVEKIVGAAAEAGADLAACKALGDRVNSANGSMGVALTSCTVPAAGSPTFAIGEDEMEMGVGIHGEPGRRRVKLESADAIATELVGEICASLNPASGERVLLHVNGFGGTPLMELYLVFHAAMAQCRARDLNVTRSLVGNYTTSLEMAGCSITICKLDDEMIRLWDAPVHTAGLRWGR